MCGIFGSTGGAGSFSEFIREDLSRRGPDSSSSKNLGECEFGFTRLAVVGLTDGDQPVTQDGYVFFLMNGEIYNHERLKKLQGTLSPSFPSDVWALPGLYQEKGDRFVNDLSGMFAIAVLDQRHRKIKLFRDSFGKKPLYFAVFDNEFWFCSRLTSLVGAADLKGQSLSINNKWLKTFFLFGHGEHLEDTVLDPIKRVLPGGSVTWDLDSRSVQVQQWFGGWDNLPDSNRVGDSLWQLLLNETEMRVPREVSFGVQLSGGVDSSLVATALFDLGYKGLDAFTLDSRDSDVFRAKQLADHLGMHHKIVRLPQNEKELREKSLDALHTQDEPFWDGFLASFFLNEAASVDHKVIFSGDGPDELFYGYTRTRRALQMDGLSKLLFGSTKSNGFSTKVLAGLYPNTREFMSWKTQNSGVASPLQIWLLAGLTPGQFESLGLGSRLDLSYILKSLSQHEFPSDFIWHSEVSLHLGQVLKKVDSSSMENSIEVRSPFLADSIASMAFQRRVRPSNTWSGKQELMKIAKRRLPTNHLDNKKYGFSFPMDTLTQSLFAELRGRVLDGGSELEKILDVKGVFQSEKISDTNLPPRILGRMISLDLFLSR